MVALPTKKLEAWRYTDLRPLSAVTFGAPPAAAATPDLPDLPFPRFVFLNGVLNAALSSGFAYAKPFVPVEGQGTQPMALINADYAQDGINIEIPAGQDAGELLLISQSDGITPFAFHPRHRVKLGQGAKFALIELNQGEGTYWQNAVFEVEVAEGAKFQHFRLQEESVEAFNTTTIYADIEGQGSYEHFTLTLGARISRTEIEANLLGQNALAHLNAAQLLGGTQHGDFTTIIRHKAPNCPSRQTVKSVLAGKAHAVFQGKIEVDQIAQKTDGYQMSQALLLSPETEMDIKPELQIFADDVKCSHGATIGALDEEQVFYLRSRGIPEAEARQILIRAFLEEALEPVTHDASKALFEEVLESWWTKQ
ncbi:Fe-S cluster assembly protein SufD [Acidocella aminolytica]|jgi:Fe-S cluster assembly protein SufD|uniref:Iron-sulfur (Fe-S) assembly protein SufD n=1 Tax=Acidocella aminolytica 101 = DSM 11237 TaxID=1120923 RepID=A0A0D6PB76_9PROT|nr:Fe-S cluster assembly protein SufD [Acidocella aminolytica]GAN78917.1 iron-sulfur (Fe-S) assembly protein SufD [Acidocella aminolytica 101 = DSM 11237]GBQ42234.1 iron-sulfur assembly protein SufD [Acidocella aminolytica 101 = DSM 11237]SHE99219.1 Iron-regulated ABC transporter permease protein SufD [Acidocella aminolytica 101 = DSM 11237]